MTRNFVSAFAFAAALLCTSASGSDAQEEDADEIIKPRPTYKVDPVHPRPLYDRGIEGEAIIVVTVDMFGNSVNPEVDRATHEEFGIAAMLAAAEWIFEPATRNGVPLEVKVKIPFEFKVSFEHRINVEFGREVYKRIEEPVIPSFELAEAPLPAFVPAFADFYPEKLRNSGLSAAVSLEFIIDPLGLVVNPRIVSISNKAFEEAAIRAICHMRYKPIRYEGKHAYVSLMMPIQLSE